MLLEASKLALKFEYSRLIKGDVVFGTVNLELIGKRLVEIDKKQDEFNDNAAKALNWIYRTHGWNGAKLACKISGANADTLQRYSNLSFPASKRNLHTVSLITWASQITMNILYLGADVEKYWPGMCESSIRCVCFLGRLPHPVFEDVIRILLQKAKNIGFELDSQVDPKLEALSEHSDTPFLMPDNICIHKFREDYYTSIGVKLREFRERFNIGYEILSAVLDVPISTYKRYEDPDDTTTIPIALGVRLKSGFQLSDTTSFVSEMRDFPGFSQSRKIQQLREEVVFELYKSLPLETKKRFSEFAYQAMHFYCY